MSPLSEAMPAASAVLVRDGSGGLEVLLLRRSLTASFGPGAWVFPGGRVDPGDLVDPRGPVDALAGPTASDLAASNSAAPGLAESAELAAARRAAVRETGEEAGLAVDGAQLLPMSHWSPPRAAPRRFRTWILVGQAPDGEVVVDGEEIIEYRWLRPADALAARDTGSLELMPPTWVTLWVLATQPSAGAALTAAAAADPEQFETRIAKVDGGLLAMWHGDAGYLDGDRFKAGDRHRLWMVDSGWRYERTPASATAG